jgi:hypothetical protein
VFFARTAISSDMRQLLAQEQIDARTADAMTLFCYQARQSVRRVSFDAHAA